MDTTLQDAGAAGVIVGWAQTIKTILPDSWTRFIPVACIGLGVIYTFGFGGEEIPVGAKIVKGVMVGFTAAGIFSGTKATFEKKKA